MRVSSASTLVALLQLGSVVVMMDVAMNMVPHTEAWTSSTTTCTSSGRRTIMRRIMPATTHKLPTTTTWPSSSFAAFPFGSNCWIQLEATSSSSSESPEEEDSSSSSSSNKVTSFDDAGQGLRDEEDNKRLEEMGDFDSNPDYQSDNIDKMRAAIRKRTAEMGLEKSKLSQEILQEAAARAAQQRDNNSSSSGGGGGSSSSSPSGGGETHKSSSSSTLDVSKIRGQLDPDMPSMFYDPEDEMSDDEKKQVDPVDTQNLLEQAKNEIVNSKWPNAMAALREVGIMLAVVAFTAFAIIQWDAWLRDFYTNSLHLIPTVEEIQSRFTGLDLPEGWTQSLNEEDVANLPNAVRDTMQ